jgi:hypothetical protein
MHPVLIFPSIVAVKSKVNNHESNKAFSIGQNSRARLLSDMPMCMKIFSFEYNTLNVAARIDERAETEYMKGSYRLHFVSIIKYQEKSSVLLLLTDFLQKPS